ncbi:hypothetical protein BREVNS_1007 [Brevinematales bacterium NS]|nr:hypothetical protein BREVNS_1007 [Brevinematales bacterium NS]
MIRRLSSIERTARRVIPCFFLWKSPKSIKQMREKVYGGNGKIF